MIVKSADGHYELVNEAMAAFFGLTTAQMQGRREEDMFPADVVEQLRASDRQVLETGRSTTAQQTFRGSDGDDHIVLLHKFRLEVEEGEAAVCGIARDITDQRRLEAQLRTRAERQEILTQLSRDALAEGLQQVLDRAVTTAQETLACDLVGVLELSATGENLLVLASTLPGHGAGGERFKISAAATSQGGYTLACRAPVITLDYATEDRFQASAPVLEAGMTSGLAVPLEGVVGRYGALTAHSSQRRAFTEEDIHFLESVGTVIAAAFARDRADRLERELQTAQRLDTVGQLAGGIAHDFNNLLGVIVNYSQFALDSVEAGSQMHDDLTEVRKAADRAADLTRQLLTFSRKDLSTPEVLNVNEVVDDVSGLLRRTLGDHVDLRLRLDATAPPVTINGAQLQRVVVNLVVNARDAMPGGGILTIETQGVDLADRMSSGSAELPPGHYLRLSVSDTGTGMSKEVLERAFEPFFTTKEVGKGTGLGLASAYGLITSAGGHAAIYSEEGTGTTVRIYLPSAAADQRLTPEISEPAEESAATRIMVVDDEPGMRTLTARILRTSGFEVQTAPSGADALLALKESPEPIDLLVTDVIMPEMSGRELAEKFTLLSPDTPVLFMSGYTGDVLSHHQLGLESVPLVEKPFTSTDLVAAVSARLSRPPEPA